MESINITIEKSEYLESVQLNQHLTKIRRRNYLLLVSMLVPAGVVALYLNLGVLGSSILGGLVGGFVGYWLQRLLYIPWRARRVYLQQKSLHDAFEIEWSDAGLSYRSKSGFSVTPWKNYLRWRENEVVFNLYHSDVLYQVFPKRALTSASEEARFRAYLAKTKND